MGGLTATRATVSWNASSANSPTGYVARAYDAETGGNVVGTCNGTVAGATPRTCNITGLSAGTQYWFAVATNNTLGEGPESTRQSATTLTLPTAPTNLRQTTSTATSVAVAWNAVAGATGYTVRAYTTADGNTTAGTACGNVAGTTASATCTITGLQANRAYFVAVSTTSVAGTGLPSARIQVSTSGPPPVVTGVTATPGAASIAVSWTAVTATPAVTSYTARAYDALGAQRGLCTTPVATPAPTTCTITGLAVDTAYTVDVTATNTSGTGPASTPRTPTRTLAPPPPPTMQPTATAGDNWVEVTWNAVAGATSYTATAFTSQAGTAMAGTGCTNTVATSCRVTGLAPGTSYWVSVGSNSAAGAGQHSARMEVTTTGTPIVASAPRVSRPTFASRTSRTLTVSWQRPVDATGAMITSYEVRVWNAASGGNQMGACSVTAPASSTVNTILRCTITVSSRTAGQAMWVEVRGLISGSPGAWSTRQQSR